MDKVAFLEVHSVRSEVKAGCCKFHTSLWENKVGLVADIVDDRWGVKWL